MSSTTNPRLNAPLSDNELYQEVLRRYWTDAEFHAEVKMAESFVDRDLDRRSTEHRLLTGEEAALVRMGAAAALIIREKGAVCA